MMKTLIKLPWLALILATFACSHFDQDVESVEPDTQEYHADWTTHFLDGYGIEASIKIPPRLSDKVEIKWNDNFGRVEISAGRSVDFFVTEAVMTTIGKRFEIESGIFSIEFIRDEEETLFYRTSLPDGSSPYYNFFLIKQNGEQSIQIENNPLVEFSMEDVQLMIEITETISFTGLSAD